MKNEPSSNWSRIHPILTRNNWLILFGLAGVSFFAMPPAFTLGVILGGLLIIINFNMLQQSILRTIPVEGPVSLKKVPLFLKYYLRLLIMGTILYIIVAREWADPIGLSVGLSTIVFSIVSYGIHQAIKAKNA
ncbi:MAG: ATP synthase subunit I [Desulfobacteraceae bacterium]|nr:MAG: ATP synthase subunit I [Desulfobacteraceae bacterium]